MEYIATKNICIKGGFIKEGETLRLEPEDASVYLDEGMIEPLSATHESEEDEAND